MGIQTLNSHVRTITHPDLWMEGRALQQLQTTAELPGMQTVVGLPDLHPGRGYPVGAAFFADRVYPALVGSDIGCGMALWQTNLLTHQVSGTKLEKKIGSMEAALDEEAWGDTIQEVLAQNQCGCDTSYHSSLGTIGAGNHFAEIQAVDTLYEPVLAEEVGIQSKQLLLLVHSGSRGLGHDTLQQFTSRFGHQGLQGNDAEEYLAKHDDAMRYAVANRHLIAQRFLQAIRAQGRLLCDGSHNFVEPKTVDGISGWLHRKGASNAQESLLILPGSRGNYTYVVRPLASPETLWSIAHGAGRKWLRQDCKERVGKRFRWEQLLKTELGSTVICGDRELLYEEAPQAYKDIEVIVLALEEAGLIQKIARLKPVLTYKTRGESCE